MTKLCKDCEHYLNFAIGYCASPKNGYSLVDGKPNKVFAMTNRNGNLNFKCGPSGDWFVQKKIKEPKRTPWWKFWGVK